MSDSVNILNDLYEDKNLKDFDIRLYLHIVANVNNDGYSKITNKTLAYKTGKKETAIKDSIKRLEKRWIVRKLNVKPNEKYKEFHERVLWKTHFYNSWRYGLNREREKERNKSIKNDKQMFIAWLKTDCKGIIFPVGIGGLVENYVIELSHNSKYLLFKHPKGEERIQLAPEESWDVFTKMWGKREMIFKFMRTLETSKSLEELAKIASERAE